jgi:hypothetical protein
VGPGDSLYVLNVFGYWRCASMAPKEVTVTVYPPGAKGRVEPARSIVISEEGPPPRELARFTRPRGMAVDRRGSVYVGFEASRIAVYAPGADGAVAPARQLTMAGTHAFPLALAAGSGDTLHAVGFPHPTICL